ncbi:TlpA disulfide reductase family protein [Halomonas sp. Bachu 37]|uniref:TlpA disulfide reductase family protein n=1 Tax=Halomonas kashgarensis TaxID=3084920 RepID=UPI00321666C5
MNAIALGPVLIALPRLYAIACALVLLLAGRYLLGLPRSLHGKWFNGLVLAWLLGARLGHVLTHWESYAETPLEIVKLWQPGYHGLWGMLFALVWSAWLLRSRLIAMGGAMALIIGTSSLWLVLVTLAPLGGSPGLRQLPELTLEDIDGEDVFLPDLVTESDIVIVNLWATWCPPCLREMPLLEQAARQEGVTVVVANQGEDLLPVVRYLDEQQLDFRYALMDPRQQLTALTQSPGLPTTVVFDSQGRAIDQHIGELTRAQLDGWLKQD